MPLIINGGKRAITLSPSAFARNILFSKAGTHEQYNTGFEGELVILKSMNLTAVLQLKLQLLQCSRSSPGP